MAKLRRRSQVMCGALFLLSCLLPLQEEAQASLITYNFEGALQSFDGSSVDVPNFFSAGQVLTGSFTYDSNTPFGSDPNFGGYRGALTNLSFSTSFISGTGTQLDGGSGIEIRNNAINIADGSTYDWFAVAAFATGPSINGYTLLQFGIFLEDASAQAFESTALGPIPSLSSFSTKSFDILLSNGNPQISAIHGTFTSLTPTPIPLPSTWLMLLSGLGLIALATCRKFQAHRSVPVFSSTC